MVRYILSSEVKHLYYSSTLRSEEGGCFPIPKTGGIKFVDILCEAVSENYQSIKVRVFCLDGEVITGWMLHHKINSSIQLFNQEELFDGRFNSNRQ